MRTLGIISFGALLLPFLGNSGCAKGSIDDTVDLDAGKGKDGNTTGSDSGGGDGSMQGMDGSMGVDSGNCMTVAPSNVCGLDPQCGCGASGTCDLDFMKLDGTTHCVQTSGTGMIKSACKATTDCTAGLTCVFGACRPYCSSDNSACMQPGTNTCHQLTANNMPVLNLLICYLDCALDDANACGGANEACVYDGTSATDCRDVTGANTTTCNQTTGICSPGYVCLTNNTCAKWCKVGGMNTCGNKTCTSLATKVIIKNQEYGICQ